MAKANVYLCAHPEDIPLYGEMATQQIRGYLYSQVYTDADLSRDRFIHYWMLREMRLFVLLVTRRLLTEKNEAMRKFRFAKEHGIPVIPWLMEEDLEELLAQRCGELPFLRKEESLDTFLQEFRIGREMVLKIRETFDGTVFLSAHPNDQRFVRQIKSLIHDCWGCGNLGFPNYQQPQPGQVFVLVLTHNTLQDETGQILADYQKAVELGLPIVAVEMVKSDLEAVKRQFPAVVELVEGYEECDLTGGILEALERLDICISGEKTPEQIFYLGMAFLYGIDVESQRQLGVRMIEYAARSGWKPAKEKLAILQRLGDGICCAGEKWHESDISGF